MENSLIKYFEGDQSELISIAELEHISNLNPGDILPKLLLIKKMKRSDTQELMLQFNDRTALHYMQLGDGIPSIKDLQHLFHEEKALSFESSNEIQLIEDTVMYQYNEKINSEKFNANAISDQVSAEIEKSELPQVKVVISDIINQQLSEVKQDTGQDNAMDIESEVPTDDLAAELIGITEHEELKSDSVDLDLSSPIKEKKQHKKKRKVKKKDKYTLDEFSGISPFSKWLLTFKKTDIDKKIKKEEKTAKRKALEASANKSIKKSATIISEPLADLLASQGHFDEAKKMYEQLMVKYPEKSSYFAAKINQNIKY